MGMDWDEAEQATKNRLVCGGVVLPNVLEARGRTND